MNWIMSSRGFLRFILLLTCGILARSGVTAANGFELLKVLQIRNLGFEFFNRLENVSLTSLRNENKSDATQNICETQIKAIRSGIEQNELWALKFFDSWGKLPSGILYGHQMEMGNFEECMELTHTLVTDNQVQGKYCMTNFPIGKLINSSEFSSILKLQIGICVPKVCKAEQIDEMLKNILAQFLPLNDELLSDEFVKEGSCQSKEKIHLEAIDWVAIAILILIAILLLASTVYDLVKTRENAPQNPLYAAFSIPANMRQLFHVTSNRNSSHVIPCLNGIRCLSLVWIIFIHCYMMLLLSPTLNSIDIVTWNQSAFAMFFQSGNIAVDSFFFLSGVLLVMVTFRQMQKTSGKINVPLMYLHRYLRLTPVLALAVLLFVSLYRYLCKGPICQSYISSWKLCEDTWWATLLFVQNYAAAGKMCLGHSWYLAVDMQLYLISPLVLIPIWKWKRKGLAGVLLIGALLFAFLFSIIIINEYNIDNITKNLGGNSDEMSAIYYSTHTRTSPWIIGIVFGYYLHNRNGKRTILPKILIVLGWFFALAMLLTVIFVLYPHNQPDAKPLTPLESAFYLSLSRIAWPTAIAWIVFACVNGYGGPINQFLSWSFWEPLSRLSYCMYIWHLLVESINAGRVKTNPYFSDYDAILRFWSNFGITICVSIIMYLAIEAPMLGIDKFLFAKDKTKTELKPKPQTIPTAAVSQITLVE